MINVPCNSNVTIFALWSDCLILWPSDQVTHIVWAGPCLVWPPPPPRLIWGPPPPTPPWPPLTCNTQPSSIKWRPCPKKTESSNVYPPSYLIPLPEAPCLVLCLCWRSNAVVESLVAAGAGDHTGHLCLCLTSVGRNQWLWQQTTAEDTTQCW